MRGELSIRAIERNYLTSSPRSYRIDIEGNSAHTADVFCGDELHRLIFPSCRKKESAKYDTWKSGNFNLDLFIVFN
ncbi:MAG: hypothetical protein NC099_00210 [Corallococcus sp.]|nr:hypothetical protein [Corallococcus sp.]